MSLGFPTKKSKTTIGQYGNGFKTSTMRLGSDAIVFTVANRGSNVTLSIGLLSYTFLRTMKDDIVVPMLDFQIQDGDIVPSVYGSQGDWDGSLKIMLDWSPFSSEEELLLEQFQDVGDHGTKVAVYNLWMNDDCLLELDFEDDDEGILLKDQGSASGGFTKDQKEIVRQHISHRLRFSLRAYASILYVKKYDNFQIILRGKPVEHISITDELKFKEVVHYIPQVAHDPQVREMEKEHSDTDKMERHCDDSKQYLDRHPSSQERWGGSSKEGNYDQCHDNKWNARWGPSGKDSENWCERSTDANRKVYSHSIGNGKDSSNHEKGNERDSKLSRSWNSSYFVSRGTGDTSDHLSMAPQKSPTSFGRELQESDSPNSTTDVRNFVMPSDDAEETSSLCQEDHADETVILKGIEIGDITNSGAQACKDGSVDKSNPNVVPLEQSELSGREDQTGSSEDSKGEMTVIIRGIAGDAKLREHLKSDKSLYAAPRESKSISDYIQLSSVESGHQYNILDQRTKVCERVGVGDIISPENLSLYYKDPKGQTQGPFPGSDIIRWFEAGIFGVDLLVRVESAPCDSPFLLLGDVIPHLRAKLRVPPGFCNSKPSMPDTSHLGSEYLAISDYGSINKNGSVSAAGNHFGKSPLSSNTESPRAEACPDWRY